jgi:2-methylcitrate dehydratase
VTKSVLTTNRRSTRGNLRLPMLIVDADLRSRATVLSRDSNQALGIGQYAIDFLSGRLGSGPSQAVLDRTTLFHTDAFLCGASALALRTNAPTILHREALDYPESEGMGCGIFGAAAKVKPEKAVVANCAAVREWDANGTNFGYRPELGHTAGEFGHNDFYPVVLAACQQRGLDGAVALRAMICLDEIRGRLAEVFSLKSYKLDHVLHGAIASAAVYGALMGATAEQIESAIGMTVAHYVPWRAIRAGSQLSDSKGASAAISAEAAVLSAKRAMAGFAGPRDVFRNPEAVFRFFEPTTEGKERWSELGDSPFDLALSHSGDDFAVMGMHFKLGLYEHQSAGALQAVLDLLATHAYVADHESRISKLTILAYEPAFGIIGNPAKMDPRTRQSADHSMAYIVATLLRKAAELRERLGSLPSDSDSLWKALMLSPHDYRPDASAIFHPVTRAIMEKIDFRHGGPEYDAKYPEGIPTSVRIAVSRGGSETELDSGLVMFPAGHARNRTADLRGILSSKFRMLGTLALPDGGDVEALITKLESLGAMSSEELTAIYDVELAERPGFE